eukprot:1157180-Pelagomonas_calceolata.AAC.3
MTQVLRHATYSAILDIEGTATFMFLPASGNLMITNPYSKLLNAYPHLCCKFGIIIIPKGELTYNNPQSWASQKIALPQHTWDFTNYCSLEYSCESPFEKKPTWLQGLARDIPKAKWSVKNVSNNPIRIARHAVMPGMSRSSTYPMM